LSRYARLAASLALTVAAAFGALSAPVPVAAQGPTFGEPVGTAPLGGPLTVTSDIEGVDGSTVDLLVRLEGTESQVVIPATAGTVAGQWQVSEEIDVASSSVCSCHFDGSSPPNAKIEFQFRVRAADGTVTLGPVGRVTVEDDRFEWQTLEADLVRVHWYEGDQASAQQAADVANDAIDRAAELLGTTLPQPVDLFVYATQQAMVEAVSPNRESIAGQADPTTDTMVVCAACGGPDEFEVTVAHELTHLVFNETTANPYHAPPRWLNEGIATYLSEGYSVTYSTVVDGAAQTDALIPLEGLAGLFPSQYDQFLLAYGESVSAVDYFVTTYSEETLWDLVRSYADGMSDDDAFTTATGSDLAAFNAAWTESLGSTVREPVGPQPAPPGPVPSAWNGDAQPSLEPSSTPAPGSTTAAGVTPVPFPSDAPATPRAGTPGTTDSGAGGMLLGAVLFVVVIVVIAVLVLLYQRNRNRQQPQPTWYPPQEPPPGPPQF
jgi:hypothetical protein